MFSIDVKHIENCGDHGESVIRSHEFLPNETLEEAAKRLLIDGDDVIMIRKKIPAPSPVTPSSDQVPF